MIRETLVRVTVAFLPCLAHSTINFSVYISENLILLRVNEKCISCEIISDTEKFLNKKGLEKKIFNDSLSRASFPSKFLYSPK